MTGVLGLCLWKLLIWWLKKENAEPDVDEARAPEADENVDHPEDAVRETGADAAARPPSANVQVVRPTDAAGGDATDALAGGAEAGLVQRVLARRKSARTDEEAPANE